MDECMLHVRRAANAPFCDQQQNLVAAVREGKKCFANIALDRVNRAANCLAIAVPRFAVSAKITVRRLWVVLEEIRSNAFARATSSRPGSRPGSRRALAPAKANRAQGAW